MFLVLGKKFLKVFVFHRTPQNLLVQLFDNLEIGNGKHKKVRGILPYEGTYDALGTQRVEI